MVFATADFMASYPTYDDVKGVYNLGPPVFVASENTDHEATKNPVFELSYWKYGLRTAIEWRKRLNMSASQCDGRGLRTLRTFQWAKSPHFNGPKAPTRLGLSAG